MAGTLRRRLHDWALVWTRPREPEALPARFDRRRVYVLPTRFGLFYAVLLLAMLLGALNYNNNPALLLGLLLAGAGLALAPGVPLVTLDPELALALFVAPVLLDAAFDASPRDLKENWRPVASLALVAVALTYAASGVSYGASQAYGAELLRIAAREL